MENKNNRILNNNYAPGIATYGIDGKTGPRGETGTSAYFTTFNLAYGDSENEVPEVLVKINQNKILSSYIDKPLNRKYDIGDIIIDGEGYLYKIVMTNGSFALQYISQLKIDDSVDFFQKIGNRVIFSEDGLDIFDTYQVSEDGLEGTDKYPLRLISTQPSKENGRYELFSLICFSYTSNPKFLNIFYDKSSESFCFDTDSNIIFDVSTLMVRETDETKNFSDYYKVEPYNDPIGLLHREYSSAVYSIEGSELIIENINLGKYTNLDIKPDFVKFVVFEDGEVDFESVMDFDKTQNEIRMILSDKIMNAISSGQKMLVSLIKGIEICIKPKF